MTGARRAFRLSLAVAVIAAELAWDLATGKLERRAAPPPSRIIARAGKRAKPCPLGR